MDGEIIASGLDFPEGPLWLDGELAFVEVHGGFVSRWSAEGGVRRVADVGGGPNAVTKGPDGAWYVTQNGRGRRRSTAGIVRVDPGTGEWSFVATHVAGLQLEGPNDLIFGADGRLWFTDPRGEADQSKNDNPGRLFVLDVASGEGELVIELGPVFPNGIAFLADGTLVWTESFGMVVNALVDGRPSPIVEMPPRHFPDGMCVGADGRLYVASTFGHCVSVVESGRIVDKLMCGDGMPTNCCFGGTDLYVTESRRGAIWRFPVGVTGI